MTTPRTKSKTTTATAATKAKPRTSTPRKVKAAQAIRNLRGTVVHARLLEQDPEKPFRIALNPRGQNGDVTIIPINRQTDPTYLKGINVLWELITETERKQLEYGPVGYLGRTDGPQVIRPEDNTLTTAKDWDGTGRRAPEDREIKRTERGKQASEREFGTGTHTVDVPGSDTGLHALLKAGQEALPPDVDLSSRRVVVERVRGE